MLDAFLSTWSTARETFGQGVPHTGERFDQSGTLRQLQTTVESAAPRSRWTGTAAAAYDAANQDHGKVFARLAALDQRLAAQVDASAQVVTSGRQDLDAVRKWVLDAANSVPAGKNREQLLMPIVAKGLGQLSQIVTKSNGDLAAIGGQIRTLGGEYQALGDQKFAKEGTGGEARGAKGDDEKKQSPNEQGAADSKALQNGTLTAEQRERLTNNTTLTPEQQRALDQGNLTLPPERMSYLQGFSREFGDKTPEEIKAIMDKSGGDGGKVADAFQLASNPNIHTGLPETEPPSIDHPSSGGKYALPDGIQKVLDGPAMTQPMSSGVFQDGRWIVPPEPTGPLQPTQGLNDLANIVQQGDRSLQHGTALDAGLMTKSQEMLDISNKHSQLGPTDDAPRWYHDNVDPTLQNMLNAVNKDDMVIHDAVTGPGSEHFLNDLTNHQWQDDGLAAGGLFDWVADDAANDPTGRAAQTAHALAEYTSSHHSDLLNLESTRGYGAEGQSLGQVNPELTRDWARAFSPYFDDMVGNNTGGNDGLFAPLDPADGSKTEPTNTRHLMSVLMSDHPPMDQPPGSGAPKTASEILFDSTQRHVHQAFENAALSAMPGGPVNDDFAMQSAGRLQAALNLGSYDEAASRLHNTFQAQHESWKLQGKLYDLGAGFVDQYGAPGAAASDIAAFSKDFVIGPEPVEGRPPNVTIPGTFPTERFMAEVLAHNGAGDMSILDGIYENGRFTAPPDQSGSTEYGSYHNAIANYLDSIGQPGAIGGLMQTYWNTYTSSIVGAT
ncbi:EspA/EspE family type VII secretion system effector [Mycolicibacterium sp. 050158]|uniref:TPR repeat region-containing protein n=1 Tax=Mycolicibacterium sp. 050158 TaxID=3090602 RepID=UPI00299CEA77|nr:EspA/EspE family type VII secretion system effector [Mycolicibacterium sp. 050158]MDX1892622.1 EspA/EspE family type VII secretion system effector [Mycolicibacterium sp. 050158]